MKSLKVFTVAATLAIAATTASAQTILMASVPFSFRAGSNQLMSAGDYSFRHTGSIWSITSNENWHTSLALQTGSLEGRSGDKPALVFHCRGNGCSLAAIRPGRGDAGASFTEPKRSKSDSEEVARVVVVPLTASNSD